MGPAAPGPDPDRRSRGGPGAARRVRLRPLPRGHLHRLAAPPGAVAGHTDLQAGALLPPGQARRDAIAAAPMLAVPPDASRSGTPAARPGPAITIPAPSRVGPADVPTGFPRIPEGAVGQLAAIEATVVQGMSIGRAHAVHHAWAAPGAVPADSWDLTASIQAFLGSAAGTRAADLAAVVVATPVAAKVKGVDGQDWVLACVLLNVTARIATQARVAYGHCERMQWTPGAGAGRWVIAPGSAPARAPSTWPGTDLAGQAGWATWTSGPSPVATGPTR
ncbi:MAG: hypothetical protein IPL43_11685 [Micropruina sp.]|nr:hypothetical protein [Micropruina sp.]